jgi:hypothetical protein
MNRWKTWGTIVALAHFLVSLVLGQLSRKWWFYDTVWYPVYAKLNYLPWLAQRWILDGLGVPQIYDMPLSWYEWAVITVSRTVLELSWWFLFGAVAALLAQRTRLIKPTPH